MDAKDRAQEIMDGLKHGRYHSGEVVDRIAHAIFEAEHDARMLALQECFRIVKGIDGFELHLPNDSFIKFEPSLEGAAMAIESMAISIDGRMQWNGSWITSSKLHWLKDLLRRTLCIGRCWKRQAQAMRRAVKAIEAEEEWAHQFMKMPQGKRTMEQIKRGEELRSEIRAALNQLHAWEVKQL